jgi:hypothetical protein
MINLKKWMGVVIILIFLLSFIPVQPVQAY